MYIRAYVFRFILDVVPMGGRKVHYHITSNSLSQALNISHVGYFTLITKSPTFLDVKDFERDFPICQLLAKVRPNKSGPANDSDFRKFLHNRPLDWGVFIGR